MSAKIDSYSPSPLRSAASRGASAAATVRSSASAGTGSSKAVAAVEPNDHLRLTDDAVNLQQFQKALAAAPAGDRSKVERVKQAIADGSYSIDAKKIAARLTRLDGELGS